MTNPTIERLLAAASVDDVDRILAEAPEEERIGAEGVAAMVRSNLRLQTEQERLRSENVALSRADPQTDLPSRRVFDERLRNETLRAARSRRSFALGILEVDDADAATLHACADVLRAYCRDADFVARLDDARFALILIDIDRESTEAAVRRILGRLQTMHPPSGSALKPAIGIAISFPVDTVETLLERADNALYAAKQAGGDRAIFL